MWAFLSNTIIYNFVRIGLLALFLRDISKPGKRKIKKQKLSITSETSWEPCSLILVSKKVSILTAKQGENGGREQFAHSPLHR